MEMDSKDAAAEKAQEAEEDEYFESFTQPPVAEIRHVPKDPRTKARWNLVSRLLFIWMDPLLWLGFRRGLKQEDLYVHPREVDSEKLLKKFNKYWAMELRRKERGGKARLWVVIFKCIWLRFMAQGFLMLIEVSLQIGQSVVLGYLANYFTLDDPSPEDTREAYLWATGLVLMAIIITFVHAHGFLLGQKEGMISRVMCTNAIYQKMLSLSQVTLGKVSTGHVINLASNDVQRFDLAFLFIHFLWISPLHLAVFTYLVYREVGWPAFIATAFVILQVPLQIFLARVFGKLRFKSAQITDKRVRVMNEVITGIRVIKMYAWEYAFRRVVTQLRKVEVSRIVRQMTIPAVLVASSNVISSSIITFLIVVPSVLTETQLTVRLFALILTLAKFVESSIVFSTNRSLIHWYDAHTSVCRIQNLLELEELERPTSPSPSSPSPAAVRLEGVTLSWGEDKKVVSDVSFCVDAEKPLLAIVGPVGAGKSTLLQCLLGELKPVEGSVEVRGQVSYASQEPWVFSGTLRDNVLLGKTFEPERYQSVLEACALDKDSAQLLHGDMTLVGERGVSLSGGQKARVSLARAVYHRADLYLLDDPLSAVDTAVARQLYDRVVCGLLKGYRVVLVTHQLQFAQLADNILALKDGHVEAYGSYEELLARGVELMQLIKTEDQDDEREIFSLHEDEEEEEDEGGEREEGEEVMNGELRVVSPSSPHSPYWRKNVMYTTESESNLVSFKTGSKVMYLGDEMKKQLPPDTSSIYSAPSMLSIHSAVEVESSKHEEMEEHLYGPPPEEKGHGTISLRTYYHYFRAGGGYLLLTAVIVVFLLGETSVVLSDWWLSDWADCSSLLEKENRTIRLLCELNTDQRVGVYGGSVLAVIILNLTRTIAFFFVCVNASRVLHNRMFASILRAPILFFDTNPIGRVLNRFSKDVGFLDDLLPFQFCEYMLLLLRFLAIILTACVSNPWVLIPAAFIMVVFVFLRAYYLKTSRDIKRLEAVARSPLYSHISTTLQGLPTIRSFHQETAAMNYFYRFQNEHSQGWYLYLVSTRWFGIRIDFVSNLFLIAVVFSSVPLVSSLNAGLVGLGLTYTVSLAGMFQYCVRLSAEVENVMISAERVMAYSSLDSEASLETLPPHKPPPPDWPSKGALSLTDVAFRYSSDLPLVLKNLSLSVKPSEKIGIVGRTGAGKSSLISVLFRLGEPFGQVTIDSVDTKEIGLHDLRQHISIIPQDPVLFSGTVRYNLDPFDEYTDHRLWSVLEQVQLKSAVQELSEGLQAGVTEGGSNFSVGQKQLFCLARALLRNNKILVLDEATANVDIKTDGIIQSALREQFLDCTVLTIAHRLNTIMDSDRILVMNKGQVKEFDQPYRLLQQPRSLFRRMVDQTGEVASHKLYEMAQEADLRRRRRGGQ